jgi:hypothetical protein
MSTPLSASYRLEFPYTSAGRPHKIRAYARIATLTPSITLEARDGATEIDWTLAAAQFADAMSEVMPSGSTFGTVTLQHKTGLVWVPIATTAVSQSVAGTAMPATQVTMVLRTTTFKKIRWTMLDTNQAAPAHASGVPGSGVIHGTAAFFYNTGSNDPSDPYFWQVGRDNQYLADASFVGWTVDLNDKVRRAAGLT